MLTLASIAERAARQHSVPVTARDVERTVAVLQVTGDLWQVADGADVPLMALCGILSVLQEEGLMATEGTALTLTEAGRQWVRDLGIPPFQEHPCPTCLGRGIALGPVAEIAPRFAALARQRPEAIQDYDQGYITEESALARVALMGWKGDLVGKELLVLGDDDLVSLAAALTRWPKRVVVLEIDERLIDFLREAAREEGVALEAVRHDLREPLPSEWLRAFDTFLTDPTESLRGFQAFLLRGLAALKGPGSAGYFGLSRREASLKKWHAIQAFLNAHGVVITDLRDDFSEYVNWPYMETMRAWPFLPVKVRPRQNWYRSAFYRIERVEEVPIPNQRYEGDIFGDEEAATV